MTLPSSRNRKHHVDSTHTRSDSNKSRPDIISRKIIEMLPKYPLLLQEYMLQPLYFLSLDAAEAVLIDSTRVSKRLYRLRFDFVAAAKENRISLVGLSFCRVSVRQCPLQVNQISSLSRCGCIYRSCLNSFGAAHWVAQCMRWKSVSLS